MMVKPNTHLGISQGLCGEITELDEGTAVVTLQTTNAMVADDQGLVHGGFIFGAADYAAMLAVNDPNVVLGAAETRFSAPVRVGESVVISARITEEKGRKRIVDVTATANSSDVFSGTFTTFILDQHVLDGN